MDERWIWFGLNELADVGWKTIALLHRHYRPIGRLLEAAPQELRDLGIRQDRAERICRELTPAFVEERLRTLQEAGGFFMTRFDPAYPLLLAESNAPPWVLYGRGDPALLSRPAIAVVGTRRMTSYGRLVAEGISRDLSRMGFSIVSGLARGIDGCAHRGGLEGEGSTIAVLAAGLTQIYPPEHRGLYERIAREGLLLTEMPIGTIMRPGLFPQRNRIVAGLALGTLVVEAAEKSGSLLTAKIATDENRDLFAVPGPITAKQSQGTLGLLKVHAKMATCAADIAEEYRHLRLLSLAPAIAAETGVPAAAEPSADERKVLAHIGAAPISFDELLARTGFTFGHLHALLLSLLITRRIEQKPGSEYVRWT